MGLAFAFGWTPCIGPILATILAVAGSQDTAARGAALLGAYSLGLGRALRARRLCDGAVPGRGAAVSQPVRAPRKVVGGLLVLTGIAFLSGGLQAASGWLINAFPALGQLAETRAAPLRNREGAGLRFSWGSCMLGFRQFTTPRGVYNDVSQAYSVARRGLLIAQSGYALAAGAIAVDDQPGSKPSDAGYGIGLAIPRESAQNRPPWPNATPPATRPARSSYCSTNAAPMPVPTRKYGHWLGDSEDDAKTKALAQCGNGLCRVVASDCGD